MAVARIAEVVGGQTTAELAATTASVVVEEQAGVELQVAAALVKLVKIQCSSRRPNHHLQIEQRRVAVELEHPFRGTSRRPEREQRRRAMLVLS